MKNLNFFLRSVCVVSIILICNYGISQNAIPKEILAVSSDFNLALEAGDLNSLVKFIHFPIKSNEFGTIENKAKLKKLYSKIFSKERISGMKGRVPTRTPDGNFELSSVDEGDPIRFLFKKFGPVYKMYCIDNINE